MKTSKKPDLATQERAHEAALRLFAVLFPHAAKRLPFGEVIRVKGILEDNRGRCS